LYATTHIQAHPDKGGSTEEFRKIQDAFDMLVSKLEDEEAAAKFTDAIYECHLRKGEPGIGFGMVVVEQPKTGYIVIKSVMPKMQLLYLSAAASGKMLENDRLMTIDEDDVSSWALARVVQRLSDFRVPPGSTVALKFSRKILKDVEIMPDQLEEIPEDVQCVRQLILVIFSFNPL
jgi:C-terminal processing protease CtpA/Prc